MKSVQYWLLFPIGLLCPALLILAPLLLCVAWVRRTIGRAGHPRLADGICLLLPGGGLVMLALVSMSEGYRDVVIFLLVLALGYWGIVLTYGDLLREGEVDSPSRFVPEACTCGYSFCGNCSGRCPECGEKIRLPGRRLRAALSRADFR